MGLIRNFSSQMINKWIKIQKINQMMLQKSNNLQMMIKTNSLLLHQTVTKVKHQMIKDQYLLLIMILVHNPIMIKTPLIAKHQALLKQPLPQMINRIINQMNLQILMNNLQAHLVKIVLIKHQMPIRQINQMIKTLHLLNQISQQSEIIILEQTLIIRMV